VRHGLLQGFGLADGAIASSLSHEAPCIFVAGSNELEHETGARDGEAASGRRVRRAWRSGIGERAAAVGGLMSGCTRNGLLPDSWMGSNSAGPSSVAPFHAWISADL